MSIIQLYHCSLHPIETCMEINRFTAHSSFREVQNVIPWNLSWEYYTFNLAVSLKSLFIFHHIRLPVALRNIEHTRSMHFYTMHEFQIPIRWKRLLPLLKLNGTTHNALACAFECIIYVVSVIGIFCNLKWCEICNTSAGLHRTFNKEASYSYSSVVVGMNTCN